MLTISIRCRDKPLTDPSSIAVLCEQRRITDKVAVKGDLQKPSTERENDQLVKVAVKSVLCIGSAHNKGHPQTETLP